MLKGVSIHNWILQTKRKWLLHNIWGFIRENWEITGIIVFFFVGMYCNRDINNNIIWVCVNTNEIPKYPSTVISMCNMMMDEGIGLYYIYESQSKWLKTTLVLQEFFVKYVHRTL